MDTGGGSVGLPTETPHNTETMDTNTPDLAAYATLTRGTEVQGPLTHNHTAPEASRDANVQAARMAPPHTPPHRLRISCDTFSTELDVPADQQTQFERLALEVVTLAARARNNDAMEDLLTRLRHITTHADRSPLGAQRRSYAAVTTTANLPPTPPPPLAPASPPAFPALPRSTPVSVTNERMTPAKRTSADLTPVISANHRAPSGAIPNEVLTPVAENHRITPLRPPRAQFVQSRPAAARALAASLEAVNYAGIEAIRPFVLFNARPDANHLSRPEFQNLLCRIVGLQPHHILALDYEYRHVYIVAHRDALPLVQDAVRSGVFRTGHFAHWTAKPREEQIYAAVVPRSSRHFLSERQQLSTPTVQHTHLALLQHLYRYQRFDHRLAQRRLPRAHKDVFRDHITTEIQQTSLLLAPADPSPPPAPTPLMQPTNSDTPPTKPTSPSENAPTAAVTPPDVPAGTTNEVDMIDAGHNADPPTPPPTPAPKKARPDRTDPTPMENDAQ